MCGIAGYFDVRRDAMPERIRGMTDRLVHRGPDGSGFVLADTSTGAVWTGDSARPDHRFDLALGHRRLSIVDLSKAGSQPMASHDGATWVVYNGEIYNHIELRQELRALGHTFTSHSDTEVLLAAYAQWGQDCLRRFNGMWAFALWDSRRRELFCARDRFGVKPFYYATGPGWFVFGSEIKALLEHPRVPRRPNAAVVYDYLSLKIADHTDETFFEGIHRLPAGHTLTYRPEQAPQLRRYWDLVASREIDSSPAEDTAAIDRFHELFEDAVRVRLRADVPLGTCLSGGVDSSSIAVTANRLMFEELQIDRALTGDRQRTFSACFEDPHFDERPFIDRAIAATGASSYRVFPSGQRLWEELPKLVETMDEPFSSSSQYSQFCVMRLAKQSGVTVTLDGQGADELMAGYPGYHGVYLATLLRAGRIADATKAAHAIWKLSGRGRSAPELLLRAAYGLIPGRLTNPVRSALAPYLGSRTPEGRSLQVIRHDLNERFEERRLAYIESRAASMSDLRTKLYDDVFRFSLPQLLRYADRNSMAASIESRLPLLDYRLAEHIFSVPLSMIMRDGWTKWIFRRAMTGRLPTEIQWRKDKLGFVTPEGVWLRDGRGILEDMFGQPLRSEEFLDGAKIRGRLDRYVSSTNTNIFYSDLLRWYVVELWMRYAFAAPQRPAAQAAM